MFEEFRITIQRVVDRPVSASGVITALVSIAVFGFVSIPLNFEIALSAAIGSFGILGALEVYHRQVGTKLNDRLRSTKINQLFERMLSEKPGWKGKLIETFEIRGLLYNSFGFEQLPIPIGVSQPLCPKCKNP